MKSILVIGYGNDLRGDDGAGRRAVDDVTAWDLPFVETLSVQQLTPEMSETLSRVRFAVFVDAYLAVDRDGVIVKPIEMAGEDCGASPFRMGSVGHSGDPTRLLLLAKALYGRAPTAWMVTIPAVRFGFGEPLSYTAERGVARALHEIRSLIDRCRNIS